MDKKIKKIFNKEEEINQKIKEMEIIIASEANIEAKIASIRSILDEIKKDLVETHIDSLTDDLTGFLTKKHFKFAFEKIVNDLKTKKLFISIIMVDIDDLKVINDKQGHLKGTEIIKGVSEAIEKSIRKSDIASRYGGDEFLILCIHSQEDGVLRVIHRIEKEIANLEKGYDFSVSATIGFSTVRSDEKISYKELFLIADKQMYINKRTKKER